MREDLYLLVSFALAAVVILMVVLVFAIKPSECSYEETDLSGESDTSSYKRSVTEDPYFILYEPASGSSSEKKGGGIIYPPTRPEDQTTTNSPL